ncbi:MAG: thioredoxin [Erysipelotrichaceae bacterium]|jgi:thioredoxin 1|nr:thioredoxin [Erysipelotrichaceae bacterium]
MKVINANEFDKTIESGKVLVDFFADWCGPCKALAPVLEQLHDESYDAIPFVKINIDENPDVAERFGIQSIPTLIVFDEGQVKKQLVGFLPKPMLKKTLDEVL